MQKTRCAWVKMNNPVYVAYHDDEWGRPCYDERRLFEMLLLEGAQAGLSWETVLNKRESYRRAFDDFDPQKISHYSEEKIQELLQNPGIIRNRRKIQSAITNAHIFLTIQEEYSGFSNYLWSWTHGKQIQNSPKNTSQALSESPLSQKISQDLKARGMSFVGPTIIYSYLQATGVIDDHEQDCFLARI